jgi:sec-independent protein translocase protein TatC
MKTITSVAPLCPEPDPELTDGGPTKPFLEHLEDVRWVLIRCLVVLAITTMGCLVAADELLELLLLPLKQASASGMPGLLQSGPLTPFGVAFRAALFGGIGISLPLILYFIAVFVFPALKQHERTFAIRAIGCGAVLFVTGVLTAYLLFVPLALRASLEFSAWLGMAASPWFIDHYASFVLRLTFGVGMAFELPVVLLFLVKMRVISRRQLQVLRPYWVIVNLVIASVVTPPDVVSALMLAAPLQILYELSVFLAKYVDRESEAPVQALPMQLNSQARRPEEVGRNIGGRKIGKDRTERQSSCP